MIALVTLLLTASAQTVEIADHPWRTVATEHYRLHYPVEAEAWALEVAGRLEAIRAQVSEQVGYAPERVVDIVVMDPYADANGFALTFSRHPRMGVFPTAPSAGSFIGYFRSWPEDLVVHEDAHLVHLLRPSRNAFERVVGGGLLRFGPLNWKSPPWVIEGYATVVEGRLTGMGRPNSDARAAFLRMLAQDGQLPTYDQLDGSDRWRGRSMRYLVGSAYLEWLEARTGPDALHHLWARMSSRERRGFDTAFEGVFGDAPATLYARFCAELSYDALALEHARPVDPGTLWQDTGLETGAPAVSPDGGRVAVVLRPQRRSPQLVVWSTEPEPQLLEEREEAARKLLERDPEDVPAVLPAALDREPLATRYHGGRAPQGPRWLPDGHSLLFAAWEPGPDGLLVPDLFVWDSESGSERRVTRGAYLREADPTPDGGAVAVRTRWGNSQLVAVDLQTGEVRELTAPDPLHIDSGPRVSPDGRTVAWVHLADRWQVALLDLQSGERSTVALPEGGTPYQLAWAPDGASILASVGVDGFIEVHRLSLDGSGTRQLTSSRGGAAAPEPTPDGQALFYLVPDALGLDLHRLDLEAALDPPVALPEVTTSVLPPPPPPPSQLPLEASEVVPRPYRLGRQEPGPLVGGAGSTSAEVLQVGLRTGDVVGRGRVVALGVLADGAVASGLSAGLVWRGLPATLRLGGWYGGYEDRTSGTGGVAASGDWDHSGAMHRFKGGLTGWYGSGASQRQAGAGQVDLAGWRWLGRAWLGGEVDGHVASGTTAEAPWKRGQGQATARVGWGPVALAGSWQRGWTDATHQDDQFRVGGLREVLLPDPLTLAHVDAPALDPQFGTVQERTRVAVEALDGLSLYAERHRVGYWDLLGASILVGLETDVELADQPLVRLPGVSLVGGVACRVEDPVLGVAERPCRSWSDYGAWYGVVWQP